MDTVSVILSTYNGSKYIVSQIDSILSQKDVAVKLFIRDDGSTDNTPEILAHYGEKYDNVSVNLSTNIGIGNSFMKALYEADSDSDYYAFADQDDVWLENKLITAIDKIRDVNGMALYASNQTVVDTRLKNPHMRFITNPVINYGTIIRGNIISGCTYVMTKSLRNFLCAEEHQPSEELLKNRIHDAWVAEVAALFGKIYFDESSYILYRQHDENAVGAMEYSALKKIKLKIHNLFKNSNSGQVMSLELLRLFSNELGTKKKAIESYNNYKKSISAKRKLLKMQKLFRHVGESKAEYILKVLLNRL